MYTVVVVEDLHIIIIHVEGVSSHRRSRERERKEREEGWYYLWLDTPLILPQVLDVHTAVNSGKVCPSKKSEMHTCY